MATMQNATSHFLFLAKKPILFGGFFLFFALGLFEGFDISVNLVQLKCMKKIYTNLSI